MPTEEELKMIKNYVLLYTLLLILAYNQAKLRTIHLKLQDIIEEDLEYLISRVNQDFIRLKLEMKKRNLRIVQETSSSKEVRVMYICRNYHSEFSMQGDHLKAQVGEKLKSYRIPEQKL